MKINLKKEIFTEKGFLLAENKSMRVTAFCYKTGVAALKIENSKGYFIILPYQGQQIWRINFCGGDLGMKAPIKEPVPDVSFLETYGGFLYHCGITSVGAPDKKHLHHGEIPNIAYDSAYLICDEDENGVYIEVGGIVNYNNKTTHNYQFSPRCRLYENATVIQVVSELKNLNDEPMEYAYLCHLNFVPIDGAELLYNAELKTVHKSIPEDIDEDKKVNLSAYMDMLEKDNRTGDIVGADNQCYTPELCCTMMYEGEFGYTMQYVKGEGAHYVCHSTKELPYAIRWISRTEDTDAMGMVLPSTCEHLGYSYIKQNGQIKFLLPAHSTSFSIEVGWIEEEKVKTIIEKQCF